MATTRAATSSSARVREPSPGPTSRTTSSGPTPESRTMRRTVLGSITKFWPRCLVGRRSSASASRRTSAGPSSLGPAEDGWLTSTSVWASPARATHRPGAVAAGGVPYPLGHGDLLLAAVLVGPTRSAVRLPGAQVELEAAVVAVARDGGPVTAGL